MKDGVNGKDKTKNIIDRKTRTEIELYFLNRTFAIKSIRNIEKDMKKRHFWDTNKKGVNNEKYWNYGFENDLKKKQKSRG